MIVSVLFTVFDPLKLSHVLLTLLSPSLGDRGTCMCILIRCVGASKTRHDDKTSYLPEKHCTPMIEVRC